MDPVSLHPRDKSQCSHRHLVSLVSKLEFVCEPHHVQTRIHGRNVDTQSLRESQISSPELVHSYLKDVTEVNEHVTGSLSPTGDVNTGSNHVTALPTSSEMLGQTKFVEIEGNVHMITT